MDGIQAELVWSLFFSKDQKKEGSNLEFNPSFQSLTSNKQPLLVQKEQDGYTKQQVSKHSAALLALQMEFWMGTSSLTCYFDMFDSL